MAARNDTSRKGKRWTEEEDQVLLENLGTRSPAAIARRVKRPVGGVKRRMERLQCSHMGNHVGAFSTSELAYALGMEAKGMNRWIQEEDLPAHQIHQPKQNQKLESKYAPKKRFYIFSEEFWEWAETHKHLIPFKKMRRGLLLPEPEWLEEAIANDKKSRKHNNLWTPEEDAKLLHLFYTVGLTQVKIGEEIGRSRRGVQRRLDTLRKKQKEEQR